MKPIKYIEDSYFESVNQMIDYAKRDIEFCGIFEFQYGCIGDEIYVTIENINDINVIDKNTFRFEGIIFDLNLVMPCSN